MDNESLIKLLMGEFTDDEDDDPTYSRIYLSSGLLVSWRKLIMMKNRRQVVERRLLVDTITHTSPKILHLRFHGSDCLDLARRLS